MIQVKTLIGDKETRGVDKCNIFLSSIRTEDIISVTTLQWKTNIVYSVVYRAEK